MEYPTYEPSHWNCLLTAPAIFSYPIIHENYVHWTQNPESHFFTADLPGVRKEEIKVEVDESTEPARSFIRKFRLPGMINVDGISAGYEDGVLTVTVPRSITSRGLFIDPAAVPERLETLARAA